MQGSRYKLATGLLVSILAVGPTLPVYAAGSSMSQGQLTATGTVNHQLIHHVTGLAHQSVQILKGTVSPMVTSGKASRVGTTDPNRTLKLDFFLKPRDKSKMISLAATGQKVSFAQYRTLFSPTSTSRQTVQNFLTHANLQVVSSTDDMLEVKGTAAQIGKALHVEFNDYKTKDFKFYSNTTDPVLPADVASVLQGIVGLTQTPYHSVPLKPKQKQQVAGGTSELFTPDEVRTAYGMIPAYGNGIDGTGRNIAILMSGDFSDNDVKTFSQTFGLPYDAKKITRKYVPGISVTPPYPVEEESTLDVEWSHALAPGANITEYEFGPNYFDSDILAGLDEIINTNPTVDVINMSFGGMEGYMPANSLDTWHTEFAAAVAKGITPVASSGDQGAYGNGDPLTGPESPASDPFVLSIGGTSLTLDANNNRVDETAWGEAPFGQWEQGYTVGSGGGYSNVFTDLAGGSMQKRPVPDVSALAQYVEMYEAHDGGWITLDGTSFAAPMWSGIVALAAQKAKHGLGWVNPGIDNIANDVNDAGAFHDITEGNNGAYQAQAGWDAVTGWGTPGNGWLLVQAMAAQGPNLLPSRLQIDGTVIGDVPFDFNQKIQNGTGTVDILGTGFGNQQGQGFVMLSKEGKYYKVPVTKWTNTDITLDVDADGTGLFSDEVPHPNQAGTYQLAVHTANQVVSNATDVMLADFLDVKDDSTLQNQTLVSGANPSYQNVTIQAYLPDGSTPDTTVPDMSLTLSVFSMWGDGDTTGFTVLQNGQPCLQNPDGSFQIALTSGQASLQVASKHPGKFGYYVEGGGIDGLDVTSLFALPSQSGTQLVNEANEGYNYAPTGRDNVVYVGLQDANGNYATEADHIQVTLTPDQNGNYPTGSITINDINHADQTLVPPPGDNSTYVTKLFGGGFGPTYLNVSDTVAESFTLTITDLDNSSIPALQVPLIFTAAHSLQITPTNGTDGVGVSITGQEPNWQEMQVNVLDQNGANTFYDGFTQFQVLGSQDYLYTKPITYQVEASYDNGQTWTPLQADEYGDFSLDLSHNKLNDTNQDTLLLRVASPVAESVTYMGNLIFSYDVGESDFTGEFTAGSIFQLTGQPMLPHMATSSQKNPQYVAVGIAANDANGNSVVSADESVVMTESSKSPLYTVALVGKTGKLQVLPPTNGTWKLNLSQLTDHQIYIASAKPGLATFQLTDVSNPGVTGTFTLDFVNSMVTSLKAPLPDSVLAGGGAQTVEVDLVDANGQPVINSADQVGLTLKKYKGTVLVKDANGNLLQADKSGRYTVQANTGVAQFIITDSVAENLSYAFTDLSESKVTGASSTGSFVSPTKFVMTPIATSTLGIDTSVPVTVTAMDSKGHALGGATVFLSFTPAPGGGTAVVNGDLQDTPLTSTALPFVTNAQGQLTITYTTPHVLPNGGTDTLVAQDSGDIKQVHVKSMQQYKFAAVSKLVWTGDGKTIAKAGTLPAGQPTTVKVTAYDARNHVLPNTQVYLSLNAKDVGGSAAVVGQSPALSSSPMPYVTDASGQITITYSTPQQLPSVETDVITAQDSNSKTPHVKSTDSYSYTTVSPFHFPVMTFGNTGSYHTGTTGFSLQSLMLTTQGVVTPMTPFMSFCCLLRSLM